MVIKESIPIFNNKEKNFDLSRHNKIDLFLNLVNNQKNADKKYKNDNFFLFTTTLNSYFLLKNYIGEIKFLFIYSIIIILPSTLF